MPTLNKLEYLDETKQQIKNALNTNFNSQIEDTDTFRSYVEKIKNIYINWPKVTEEGTKITLENTKKGKMNIDPKGQTSQESTSGKQLFDLTKITSSSSFGITATINENTGEIILNGTSTSTAYLGFDLDNSIPSGTIVSYGANNSLTKNNCYLNLALEGATKQVLQMNTLNAKNENITLDTDINRVYIQVNSGITLNNFVIKPMLNVGNVLEQYEPYTNGPAPNPDYPYPIKKVTGDNNVKIENKNLLPSTLTTQSLNGVQVTRNSDGSIKLNGTTNASTDFKWFEGSLTLPAGTYYIGLVSTSNNFNLYTMGTNGTNTLQNPVSNSYTTLTLSEETTFTRISSYLARGKTFNNETFYPMICKSLPFNYVEHKEQNFPLTLGDLEVYEDGEFMQNSGKNILNNDNLSYIYSNVNSSYNTVTKIDSGIKYKTTSAGTPLVLFKSINLTGYEGKTVRMKSTFGTNGNIRLYLVNEDGTSRVAKVVTNVSNEIISFVIPNDLGNTPYLGYALSIENGNNTIDFTNLIITIDNEDTEYEPYGTNEWYLKNYYGKVVLDGSESWQNWNLVTTEPLVGFILDGYVDYDNSSGTDVRGLSNYFKVFANAMPTQQSIGLRQTGDSIKRIYLAISNEIVSNLTEFKSWLSNHNTELVYLSATPTYTKITSLTLIDELENIKNNAKSYKDVTNINQTNDELPFIITASGLKKGSE